MWELVHTCCMCVRVSVCVFILGVYNKALAHIV